LGDFFTNSSGHPGWMFLICWWGDIELSKVWALFGTSFLYLMQSFFVARIFRILHLIIRDAGAGDFEILSYNVGCSGTPYCYVYAFSSHLFILSLLIHVCEKISHLTKLV
jgi:hypothetical protein